MPEPSDLASVRPNTAAALLRTVAVAQAVRRVPTLAAGVVREGTLAWSGARGQVGEGGAGDTQSRIGSITKTFTAVLVARLRDEGRLDFADQLERHLPGTPLGERTIAQLLSHTAGVQAERDGPWWERTPGADWAALAATFGPETARHRGGRHYHYSNLGYAILGELVARLRGRSWWEALRAEVLAPLGMRRTTYLPEAPHLSGYAVHPWADVVLAEPAHDSGAMAPAGQLWSTVADLARWAAFACGDTGEVLAPDTLAEMLEPQGAEPGAEPESGYGLGWRVARGPDRTLVGHSGSMPGFLAGFHVDRDAGVGGVVLANTTSGLDTVGLCRDLIVTLVDMEPRLPDAWVPVAHLPEDVLEIVGPWYWGPTGYVLRAVRADHLELAQFGGGGSRASRFRRNADGSWTGLHGYFAGETLRICRVPDGSVSHLDIATFVFTRAAYDPDAPVPGGVEKTGWTGRLPDRSRPDGST
jgi:CubicO group peptidase (beta-lactamase class C family)